MRTSIITIFIVLTHISIGHNKSHELPISQLIYEQKIPTKVKDSFIQKFPGCSNPLWTEVNDSSYVVEFKYQNYSCQALFKGDGLWQRTTTYIYEEDLPAVLMETINTKYPENFINSAELHQVLNNEDYYYLEIEVSERFYAIEISINGTIISEVFLYEDF